MVKSLDVPLLNGALLSVAIHSTAVLSVASPRAYLLDQDRVDADVRIPLELEIPFIDDLGYELGFGAAVALDGTRMIVGMPIAGVPGTEGGLEAQDGTLFVYEIDSTGAIVDDIPTTLTMLDAIEGGASFTGASRRFGRALDANSGYLLVSVREDSGDFLLGAGVLLTEWNGTDYAPKTRIFRPWNDVDNGGAIDFGAAVQVSPSHTIIGVPDLPGGNPMVPRGGIYVAGTQSILPFSDVETTNSSLVDLVVSPSAASETENGRFGHSVALDGNILVVGAPAEDIGTVEDAGRAHVYQYSANQWSLLTTLESANPAQGAQYGFSCDIVIDGNETVIVIGAPADTDTNRSGQVEVWRRVGTGSFTREAILTDEDAIDLTETRLPFSSFGFSVKALDKNNIVIGRVNSYDLRNDNQHDPDPGSEAFVDPSTLTTAAYPFALEPSAFVFRYDGTETEWEVHRSLVPSRVNTTRSWAGWSMDAVPDGNGGFIVALGDPLGSALQPGLGSAFLFDAFADPIDEYDANGDPGSDGTSDAWHIKQDIEDGFPNRLDLNGDGRVDVPPTDDDCVRQIVLIVDTSGSINQQLGLFDEVFRLVDKIQDLFPSGEVEVTVLGIGVPFEGMVDSQPRFPDGNAHDYSNIVPRRNNDPTGVDPDPDWVPVLPPITVPIGASEGTIRKTGVRFIFERSEFDFDNDDENWGPATAIVAEHFPWRSSYRVIVPISDEPGFLGRTQSGGALPEAYCVMQNANGVLKRNNVMVYPLITPEGGVAVLQSAIDTAKILTGEPVGVTFPTFCPAEAAHSVGQHIIVPDTTTLSDQGDQSVVLGEPNLADLLIALGNPSACEPEPTDCADANGDGLVNLSDLNIVLANFGQTVTPWTNGDVTGDGLVNLQDLNRILAQFGTVCEESEKSFSMSLTDPEEIPVTTWLLLRDYTNAEQWLQSLSQFTSFEQLQEAADLREWVEGWEGGSQD